MVGFNAIKGADVCCQAERGAACVGAEPSSPEEGFEGNRGSSALRPAGRRKQCGRTEKGTGTKNCLTTLGAKLVEKISIMRFLIVIVGLCVLCSRSDAQIGGVTLARSIHTYAYIDDRGTVDGPYTLTVSDNLFDASPSATANGSFYSVTAGQNSSISLTSGQLSLAATGEASFNIQTLAAFNGSGGFGSTSTLTLTFDLSQPLAYNFSADITQSKTGSNVFLEEIFTGPVFSTQGAHTDSSGILPAGQYKLGVACGGGDATGSSGGNLNENGSASYDFTFTVAPEPSELALAAIGALIVTRRKRSPYRKQKM